MDIISWSARVVLACLSLTGDVHPLVWVAERADQDKGVHPCGVAPRGGLIVETVCWGSKLSNQFTPGLLDKQCLANVFFFLCILPSPLEMTANVSNLGPKTRP
jgi:hypothetical protein